VREFSEKYGLDGSKGGAAHMWREVWDEQVSKIYADTLSQLSLSTVCADFVLLTFSSQEIDEPKFGLPPKPDRYADIRGVRRYIK
jgi:large subunit ribosomal protein L35